MAGAASDAAIAIEKNDQRSRICRDSRQLIQAFRRSVAVEKRALRGRDQGEGRQIGFFYHSPATQQLAPWFVRPYLSNEQRSQPARKGEPIWFGVS